THIHRVRPGGAAPLEREVMRAGGVDLVDHVFVMTGRLSSDAPRFPHPPSENAGRLLTAQEASQGNGKKRNRHGVVVIPGDRVSLFEDRHTTSRRCGTMRRGSRGERRSAAT